MSGHGQRRFAKSSHKDGLATNWGALGGWAHSLGTHKNPKATPRLQSRDNYQFSAQRKQRTVYRPKGQQFEIDELGLTRADAHRFRTYQGDKWPPAIVVNFSPPRVSEHQRDEMSLMVLEWQERRDLANLRCRVEYGI